MLACELTRCEKFASSGVPCPAHGYTEASHLVQPHWLHAPVGQCNSSLSAQVAQRHLDVPGMGRRIGDCLGQELGALAARARRVGCLQHWELQDASVTKAAAVAGQVTQ